MGKDKIVFAILEKTKILGLDTIEGQQYTKKNYQRHGRLCHLLSGDSIYPISSGHPLIIEYYGRFARIANATVLFFDYI